MRRRLVPALLAALALAIVLASCGGGSTTTVKEQTVMRRAKQQATQTLLPEAGGKPQVKPTTYRFQSEGNMLSAKELAWHAWGEPKATAFGKLVEKPASGLEDTFNGSVTASAPQLCNGAMYYTQILAHLPKQADFVPTEPTELETPCG